MTTLTVLFVGLIAFAPTAQGYWAFVVNAGQDAVEPSCADGGTGFVVHTGYLLVPRADLELEQGECPCGVAKKVTVQILGQPNVPVCSIKLEGYDLEIEVSSDSPVETASGAPRGPDGRPARPSPRDAGEARDFAWTRVLSQATRGEETLKASCLQPDPLHPSPDSLSPCDIKGRLQIDRGRLETECIVPADSCPDGYSTYSWVRSKVAAEPATSLGEGVRLEITDIADSPRIHVRPFGSDEPVCTLTYKAGPERRAFLIHQPEGHQNVVSCTGSANPHHQMFRYFYKLAEDPSSERDCVYPMEACPAKKGYPRCPLVVID